MVCVIYLTVLYCLTWPVYCTLQYYTITHDQCNVIYNDVLLDMANILFLTLLYCIWPVWLPVQLNTEWLSVCQTVKDTLYLFFVFTLHCTLHIAHCTLHSTQWTLHTKYCTLHTTNCTIHTVFHCAAMIYFLYWNRILQRCTSVGYQQWNSMNCSAGQSLILEATRPLQGAVSFVYHPIK